MGEHILKKSKIIIVCIVLIVLLITILYINSTRIDEHNNSYKGWSYDKKEYPLEEYALEQLPVSHKSAYEVRQFFEDSDINHDGVLKGNEINMFDYKIKHSQSNYNGPYGYQ